jgi:hypothetical protein
MSIDASPWIRDLSRSWLYFVATALGNEGVTVLHQGFAPRAENGQSIDPDSARAGFVIAGPALEWRLSPSDLDTVEASFRLDVVTAQAMGNVLSAYDRNLAIQLIIHRVLFAAARLRGGYSTGGLGGNSQYGAPLYRFSETGEVLETVAFDGLQYGASSHWIDRTPNSSASADDSRIWSLELRADGVVNPLN